MIDYDNLDGRLCPPGVPPRVHMVALATLRRSREELVGSSQLHPRQRPLLWETLGGAGALVHGLVRAVSTRAVRGRTLATCVRLRSTSSHKPRRGSRGPAALACPRT